MFIKVCILYTIMTTRGNTTRPFPNPPTGLATTLHTATPELDIIQHNKIFLLDQIKSTIQREHIWAMSRDMVYSITIAVIVVSLGNFLRRKVIAQCHGCIISRHVFCHNQMNRYRYFEVRNTLIMENATLQFLLHIMRGRP